VRASESWALFCTWPGTRDLHWASTTTASVWRRSRKGEGGALQTACDATKKKANAAGDVDLSVKSNAAVLPASRLTAGKRSRQTIASHRQYISPQSKVGCFFIGLSSGEQEFGRALRRLGCKVYRFDVLQGKKGDVLWLPSFSKTFPSPYLQWVLLGSTSRTSMWIFHTGIGNCSLCPKERTVSRGHS